MKKRLLAALLALVGAAAFAQDDTAAKTITVRFGSAHEPCVIADPGLKPLTAYTASFNMVTAHYTAPVTAATYVNVVNGKSTMFIDFPLDRAVPCPVITFTPEPSNQN